jgi:hypothetical protein
MILIPVKTKEYLDIVIDVINKYAGLISPKVFSQTKQTSYYIISIDKEPVGVYGYRPLNDWVAEQVNLVILPENRGNNYGKQASNLMTELLFSKGYGKVFSTVNAANSRMINIKRNLGYIEEGFLRNHFNKSRDIYIFSKFNPFSREKNFGAKIIYNPLERTRIWDETKIVILKK